VLRPKPGNLRHKPLWTAPGAVGHVDDSGVLTPTLDCDAAFDFGHRCRRPSGGVGDTLTLAFTASLRHPPHERAQTARPWRQAAYPREDTQCRVTDARYLASFSAGSGRVGVILPLRKSTSTS
jgi:hypothetical protein